MTKYIERDKAVKLIFLAADTGRAANALSLLGKESVADVVEVVHGKWIGVWGDGYANGFIVYEEFECSRCGCVHHADGEPTWDYCPQCGARMDGGENK